MSKLNWGMIGGGEGSQIGPVHRIAAEADGLFTLCAGALDADAEKGREFAERISIPSDRAYGDWQEMLAGESVRPDRVDLVTVATPNSTHYEITRSFLENDFNVLVEKPMTMAVDEAREIVRIANDRELICAVNYGYTGYPLVREMRAMVAEGHLGEIRLIKAEFAHGFHADASQADNPRERWRYDPDKAGVSAVFTDVGIHAFHLACFVTGQTAVSVSADFATLVKGRALEDDAMLNIRMSGGTLCRLWASSVAVGRMHGLTIQVFGEKGGLRWSQEQANQLFYTPVNFPVQTLERGYSGLSGTAASASRTAIGHVEGMPLAFANIYRDIAVNIRARRENRQVDPEETPFPTCEDGLHSMEVVFSAVESAGNSSAWVEI